MSSLAQYEELLADRSAMYRLLSGFFLKEVDAQVLGRLKAFKAPQDASEPALAQGFAMLSAFLANPPGNLEEELAADYARIFLGAGCIKETVAYPYESVYTSKEKLVCQDAYEAVYKIFRAEGVGKADKDLFEDHAALEFSFMAHLCDKALEAARQGDEKRLSANFDKQAAFVEKHLLNWIPRWCADIRACPGCDFYKAASYITDGFLALEKELFKL